MRSKFSVNYETSITVRLLLKVQPFYGEPAEPVPAFRRAPQGQTFFRNRCFFEFRNSQKFYYTTLDTLLNTFKNTPVSTLS